MSVVRFFVQFGFISLFGFFFCYALIWNYESSAMNEKTFDERKRWIWRFSLAGAIILGLIWAWSLTGFRGLREWAEPN